MVGLFEAGWKRISDCDVKCRRHGARSIVIDEIETGSLTGRVILLCKRQRGFKNTESLYDLWNDWVLRYEETKGNILNYSKEYEERLKEVHEILYNKVPELKWIKTEINPTGKHKSLTGNKTYRSVERVIG